MPKYKITEIDNTGAVQASLISNTVYIPGKAVGDAIEPRLYNTLSALRSKNYANYTAGSENTPILYDDDTLSYKLMEHLLSLGVYVLYEGVKEVEAGKCPEIDWDRLQDRGLYDIRFLTLGGYSEEQSGMVTCAEKRGDCIALLDHPSINDLNSGELAYELISSKPDDWAEAWSTKYNGKVYTEDGGVYTLVVKAEAPEFVADTYYQLFSYSVLSVDPAGWTTNWTDTYKGNVYTKDGTTYTAVSSENAPTFEADTYYTRTQTSVAGNSFTDKIRNYFAQFKYSSYASAFTPGWYTKLTSLRLGNDEEERIPASFGYLFAYAKSIQSNPEWYAVAGGQRGLIDELSRVEYEYSSAEIEVLQGRAVTGEVDLDDEYDNVGSAINPIAYVRPFGNIIWGNRTTRNNDAVKKTVASSFLNVRNLVSAVKKALYNAARKYTFEQNSDLLWVNFKSQVIPLLDQMQNGNGILGYKFVKLATTAKARLKARLIIIPIEAVEDFEIEVELSDTISTDEE